MTITSWRSSHRALFLAAAVLIALAGVGLALAWGQQAAADGDDGSNKGVVLNTTIDMTCFPPPPPPGDEPGLGQPPPCALPSGLDPRFISPDPSGRARLKVRNDDTAEVEIELDGLAPDLVVTAWLAYFFPPNVPSAPAFDIFRPIGEGMPPLAGVSAPLAPTDAAFTEGLRPEPNQFFLLGRGESVKGRLVVNLDYNPLKSGQGPLRNEVGLVTQPGQPVCCPNSLPSPRPQPIGGSYLREFDPATGFQVLGPEGRPKLLRSPVPVAVIALVAHIDETTHGLSAGIPIPPIPGISATTGDHYTLGLFDLRQFHMEE